MVARARLVSFLESFVSAWKAADHEDIAQRLSGTAMCHFSGDRSLMPHAGHYEGRAEILKLLKALETDFDCVDFRISDVLGSRSKHSVRWSATLINRGTRERMQTGGVAHVEFSGESVAYLAIFADTAAMARLIGWSRMSRDAEPEPVFRQAASASRSEADAFFVSIQEGLHGSHCAQVVRRWFEPKARARFVGAGLFPPFSGTHSGHAAIIASVLRLHEALERTHGHIHDILVEGNRACVHSRLRLRHRRTDRTADVDTCDLYVLDHDGGIVEWTAYCDTGLLAYLAQDDDPYI